MLQTAYKETENHREREKEKRKESAGQTKRCSTDAEIIETAFRDLLQYMETDTPSRRELLYTHFYKMVKLCTTKAIAFGG